MKKKIYLILCVLVCNFSIAQEKQNRILNIKNKLEILSTNTYGLTENVKTEISVNNITLSNFLLAVSDLHKVNINVAPELSNINIANNFTDVTVADLLVFLCKEYNLTIDFTGNILSIKKLKKAPKKPKKHIIPVTYSPSTNTISIDAKNDKLYNVFKQIMDETGKNLVFTPGIENKLLTLYIKQTPFESAMDKLALANNLNIEQTEDGFYIFKPNTPENFTNSNNSNSQRQRPNRKQNSNFYFKIINAQKQLLEVDFVNTPIANIINDIAGELNLDIFTASPLEDSGVATFKAKNISFDTLLIKLFEKQITGTKSVDNTNLNAPNNINKPERFTFKKEGDIYFFGTENQLSVRQVAIINLLHRSVELLTDPAGGNRSNRSAGRNFNSNTNLNNTTQQNTFNPSNRNRERFNNNNSDFDNSSSTTKTLASLLPDDVKNVLDIKVDYELNSFYVNGPSTYVERFKSLIRKIDKPVPVVLIEVMILEINKNTSLETGVNWGIANETTTTQGAIFPETDLTLGANTINRIIGGFNSFGSINIGKVIPNFFATIQAMETNGDLKIRSTPRISTLNGHRATFSNGQTSYYTNTNQSIIGSDNPITQTAVNFTPIDAELGLTIKPLVSGNGQVTMDIFVVQSSFGVRISNDAPPDINSREFSSIIRVKDQDIVVLGGLEEQSRNNSGSGVPLLARIPIIKWLFSKRVRTSRKSKLTVLIKPTIIY